MAERYVARGFRVATERAPGLAAEIEAMRDPAKRKKRQAREREEAVRRNQERVRQGKKPVRATRQRIERVMQRFRTPAQQVRFIRARIARLKTQQKEARRLGNTKAVATYNKAIGLLQKRIQRIQK